MERVDVVGVRGGEVLGGLLGGEDLLRGGGLLRLRLGLGRRAGGEGRREVGVLEVGGGAVGTRPRESRRRDAVAAQALLESQRRD